MRREFLSPIRRCICLNSRKEATRFLTPLQVRPYTTKLEPAETTVSVEKTSSERCTQIKDRIQALGGLQTLAERYPRYEQHKDVPSLTVGEYRSQYSVFKGSLSPYEADTKTRVTVHGRLVRKRRTGAALNFFVIGDGENDIQCTVNLKHLPKDNNDTMRTRISSYWRSAQRGDWMVVTGHVLKTKNGELGLLATAWPETVSPTLRIVPEQATSQDFLKRNRHVDQILNPESRNILILRHRIIKALRSFFVDRDFVEVSTPLLVQGAGGAIARPFETYATEFSDLPLHLRIAPELWLKRLIVGNMHKVFELGPAFRNEGVDNTHNPEFTICEFYQAFATLPTLMLMTEDLFGQLNVAVRDSASHHLESINLKPPFRQLPFIPTLVNVTRTKLPQWTFPDVRSPNAKDVLFEAFDAHHIPRPKSTHGDDGSIPQLLDILASHVLEPLCDQPTFITQHPECMSPLAKSYKAQYAFGSYDVAARAELFIQSKEYVNCYEEENSPVEQRRKLEEQLSANRRDPASGMAIDENYIQTLEWGMPPTGGWGCGVDRIVMLFTGKRRIADVLPFGNLTNVVRLGNASSRGTLGQESHTEEEREK